MIQRRMRKLWFLKSSYPVLRDFQNKDKHGAAVEIG